MLIIATPLNQPAFERLLGDGSGWGMEIRDAVQPSPERLAQGSVDHFELGADGLSVTGLVGWALDPKPRRHRRRCWLCGERRPLGQRDGLRVPPGSGFGRACR